MLIEDAVYGSFEISEPVLAELIASAPVQRLKRIGQAGASKYAIPNRDGTRYEHSVGVMLLLRLLGASVEEQIAGLLHDVCHTAFSHVVDVLYPSKENDYHEIFKESIIHRSEIPRVLKRYGYNVEKIIDESRFPLLERKIPKLCADRIDYSLRDYLRLFGNKSRVDMLVQSLRTLGNEIVFENEAAGEDFALMFLEMDEKAYAAPIEGALYFVLADALKIALAEGVISEEDFFTTDDEVMRRLRESKRPEILGKLSLLRAHLKIELNQDEYDYSIVPKLRYVDPGFIAEGGKAKMVSEVSERFVQRLEAHKKALREGYHIRIVG